jgi:hypothetical protein
MVAKKVRKPSKKKKTAAKKTTQEAPKPRTKLKAAATLAFWGAIIAAIVGAAYKLHG